MKFTFFSATAIFAVIFAISTVQGAPVESYQLEERAYPQGNFQGTDWSQPAPIFGSSPRQPLDRQHTNPPGPGQIKVEKEVHQTSEPGTLGGSRNPWESGPSTTTTITGGKGRKGGK